MIIFNPHKTVHTLNQLLPADPVIVEAGAFDGNDTIKMALQWPNGTIHAFEPLPEIYARLHKNVSKINNIFCYPFALSAQNDTALFYVSERPTRPGVPSQAGSLHKPKLRLLKSPLVFPRTAIVTTITLDTWAEKNSITKIDLLWLDTQGHELVILHAAPHILSSISLILAEVSFIESYEGQPLYEDVVTWMEKHGFDYIGRDFIDTTTSFFGNALFVRRK